MYKICKNNLVQDLTFKDGYRYIEVNSFEYQKWLSDGNTPEPEFTEEVIIENGLNEKRNEYQLYLSSTDFYYARYSETGEAVPNEVVAKRKEARAFIRANK